MLTVVIEQEVRGQPVLPQVAAIQNTLLSSLMFDPLALYASGFYDPMVALQQAAAIDRAQLASPQGSCTSISTASTLSNMSYPLYPCVSDISAPVVIIEQPRPMQTSPPSVENARPVPASSYSGMSPASVLIEQRDPLHPDQIVQELIEVTRFL
jgi:hypothetical protein